jgi:hypothetical protein
LPGRPLVFRRQTSAHTAGRRPRHPPWKGHTHLPDKRQINDPRPVLLKQDRVVGPLA